ncbi:MAG TPA: FAD-dependent oxidoreductase [Clostridia bacterium]|nr:FAD-dependent oxidoreductase [Clostridia bacterium]
MEVSTTACDLAVVGGGPAGAACAITAARAGASVLLLEQGQLPRHRVCGEFISPESLNLLATLLGPESRLLSDAPRITSARILVNGNIFAAPIEPAAASIPRHELDTALWHAAQSAGVDARLQTTVESIAPGRLFTIKTAARTFRARSVVNATGRWSRFPRAALRKAYERAVGSKWIGIKAHFSEVNPSASCDLYFFDGGYCGVQPVGESRLNVCAMVRADVGASMQDFFTLHPELARRSQQWHALMAPVTTSPLLFAPAEPDENGILFAGDAAGFIDPFVGDGIALALAGGALAAECLTPFCAAQVTLHEAVEHYRQSYKSRFGRVFRNASLLRRLISAPPRMRTALIYGLRIPAVARWAVASTRGKAAFNS